MKRHVTCHGSIGLRINSLTLKFSVFDADQGDERLFQQIHAEFKGLVSISKFVQISKFERSKKNLQIDMLISSFCEDTGIKPDKVAEALKTHTTKTQVEQVSQEISLKTYLVSKAILSKFRFKGLHFNLKSY